VRVSCCPSPRFICIEQCLCGTPACRQFVRGDDYRIVELQERYAGHFLPYIQKRISAERAIIDAGGVVGGAGGPDNDFSAAAVRKHHQSERVDVAEHNRRGIEALVARFAMATSAPSSTSGSSPDSSPRSTRRVFTESPQPIETQTPCANKNEVAVRTPIAIAV
jgi:hypothetical protein